MSSSGDESRRSRAPAIAIRCSLLLLFAGALIQAAPVGDVSLTHQFTFGHGDFVFTACHGQSTAGCTVFSGFTLICVCSSEDGWRIRSHVDASAQTYVSNAAYVAHELRHVADVRSRLEAYAAKLGTARFESNDDCDRATSGAASSFEGFVKDVIRTTASHLDRKGAAPVPVDSRRQ